MDSSSELEIVLGDDARGHRVDRALVDALAARGHFVTRSQLARAFAAGQVRRGHTAIKGSATVDGPWVLTVRLPTPQRLRAEPEDLPLQVVHEDEHLLVVDKPAGMVVHPGPGHPRGSLVAAVLHHLGRSADELPVLPGNDALRPGIVHRLDKDTSGLLVITKTMQVQARLADQFARHDIERSYLGVVLGRPAFERRRVETAHGRDSADRRRFSPAPGGRRNAISEVEVVQVLQQSAVLRFTLHTGRTHQIRMHARHLGHPIFGDDLYGRAPRDSRGELWRSLGRHALHAQVLGFEHPQTGAKLRFESPLPSELVALVAALRQPAVP